MSNYMNYKTGMDLMEEKKYKPIIIIEIIALVLGLIMIFMGIIQRMQWDYLQENGVEVHAICYGSERESFSEKKPNKKSYYEWSYNGVYYLEDVSEAEPEEQIAEIGKIYSVYLDPENPSNYILETDEYYPNRTLYMGLFVIGVFGMLSIPVFYRIIKDSKNKKK